MWAARCFGTHLRLGYFHFHFPPERAARNELLAITQSLLGEERFKQLMQEGQALTFMQMLGTVREFL
jgi:hypothetical protein